MHPAIVRNVLYPLHERLRGRPTMDFLRRFRQTEGLAAADVAKARDEALVALLRHAATTVPHWRDMLRGRGVDPAGINGTADLALWPVTDKRLLRQAGEALVSDAWRRRVFQLATGGSSGEPLIFWTDKRREASQLAAKLRAREWWGIKIGDPQADIWGSPIEIGANDRLRALKDRLLNFELISAFRLSDEAMLAIRRRLEALGARFVYGYASVLARYARFLEQRGEDLGSLGLKAAISTAEVLFADQREVIERVFRCRVVNEYGCRDGGFIAQECPSGRMHLAADAVHVEILDGDRPVAPGEAGEIAVTNLWSYGMPMIRYKPGDRGRLDAAACECRRSLPVLAAIEGRVTDTLVTPEGNRVHGLGLMYVIRVLPGVERFQVVQDAIDHVDILIVPATGADMRALAEAIRSGVTRLLGPRMRIDVRGVEVIPLLPSGKMRSVWNRIEGRPDARP